MHFPVEKPIGVLLTEIFLFLFIGRMFQSFAVKNFQKPLHKYLLDYSVAFMFTGTSIQYTFISFYYGSFYATFLNAFEYLILYEISLGGTGNPLDNMIIPVSKDWRGLARISFQVAGAFNATLLSLIFWNITYGKDQKTILTTTKGQDPKTIDEIMCTVALNISAPDGFVIEMLGSIVRLVVAQWSFSKYRWTNKLVRLGCKILLKIQGGYMTNYVVNPLYIVNFYILCPNQINLDFFLVYCIAPILGVFIAVFLDILPHKIGHWKQKIQKKKPYIVETYRHKLKCFRNKNC